MPKSRALPAHAHPIPENARRLRDDDARDADTDQPEPAWKTQWREREARRVELMRDPRYRRWLKDADSKVQSWEPVARSIGLRPWRRSLLDG